MSKEKNQTQNSNIEPFTIQSLEQAVEGYKDLFNNISAMAASEIANVSGCKFCHHPKRFEAELKWEQSRTSSSEGNLMSVFKFINESGEKEIAEEDKVSYSTVKTHIHHHYNQQQKRIALREYGTRLAAMMNYKIHQDHVLDGICNSLQMKFYDIASDMDTQDLKKVDAMTKLSKSISEIMSLQKELRKDVNEADILRSKFQAVFVRIIDGENNPERQKYIMDQLKLLTSDSTIADKV